MRLIVATEAVLVLATSCLSQKECSSVRTSAKPEARELVRAWRFAPAFHQVLRESFHSRRATYRVGIPIQRSGERVRVTFQAGDGRFQLHAAGIRNKANVQPTALTFGGRAGFNTDAGQLVQSDPIAISLQAGNEILVAFEIEGAVAVNSFERFPEGSTEPGSHVFALPDAASTPFRRGIGLTSIDIEGEPSRAIVAIGDSITEGYISGHDDIQDSWPMMAQRMLGVPVVGAAVSGQGVDDALQSLARDVSTMEGITDCVVLLGTNDLADRPDTYIISRLEELARRLRSSCQVWMGTILPKEWTPRGSYPMVEQRRQAVNDWLREWKSDARVIDFDATLRDRASPHRLRPGASADGIHLSARGHRLVARELARAVGLPLTTNTLDDFPDLSAVTNE